MERKKKSRDNNESENGYKFQFDFEKRRRGRLPGYGVRDSRFYPLSTRQREKSNIAKV